MIYITEITLLFPVKQRKAEKFRPMNEWLNMGGAREVSPTKKQFELKKSLI